MIAAPIAAERSPAGAEQRAAIERGEAGLRAWVQLLETGTDEQVEAELCWRGAMIRADVLAHRAIAEARGWHELTWLEIATMRDAAS